MSSFARKIKSGVVAALLAQYSVVLYAQNDTSAHIAVDAKPRVRQVKVENVEGGFPSAAQAQSGWRQDGDGGRSSSPDIAGPAAQGGPSSANRVQAAPLPSPKINYQREALDSISPMNPQEINRFKTDIYERSNAGSGVPGGPFTTETRQVHVDTSLGAKPVTIRIAVGQGCMVTLVDRTGAPLLIDAIEAFSPSFATRVMATERAETEGTNIFSVQARSLTGGGNLAVQLIGQIAPVTFNVEVGRGTTVDAQLQVILPFTSTRRQQAVGERVGAEADAQLPGADVQGFLAGIPPEGAQDVTVKNRRDVGAWAYKGRLYLRTRLNPISPGYYARFSSSDGMAVYELPMVPVVTLTGDGREVEAELSFPVIPTLPRAAATR